MKVAGLSKKLLVLKKITYDALNSLGLVVNNFKDELWVFFNKYFKVWFALIKLGWVLRLVY